MVHPEIVHGPKLLPRFLFRYLLVTLKVVEIQQVVLEQLDNYMQRNESRHRLFLLRKN